MSGAAEAGSTPKVDKIVITSPVWSAAKANEIHDFEPVDTINETVKITAFSGLFLGGMHLRRLLQHRKGSARPSHARYLSLFELNKRHFISIPLALGTYSFVSNSLLNIKEERKATSEILAVSSGVLVASIFKPSMPLNAKIGMALGVGLFAGFVEWAGGLNIYDSNYGYLKSTDQLKNQESNKSLDEDFEKGTYKKQGFWELVYRKPLSQTIEELGEGRGIGKI